MTDAAPMAAETLAELRTLVPPTTELYADLQLAFNHFNQTLFDGKLPLCVITLQRERHTLGYHSFERFVRRSGEKVDEIALNPRYFAICTIQDTLSTLAHEQVHLWQYHFGTPGTRGYHNKEWAARMESVGLMPSHNGQPGGDKVGYVMDHYIIAGGRFDVACAQLLTQRFQLQWLDRFPPEQPRPPIIYSSSGKGFTDDTDADEDDDQDDIEATASSAPAKAPVALDAAEQAALAALIEYPAEDSKSKSNRSKYRCPKCGTQAWGKPELSLLCGSDKHPEGPARMEFVHETRRPLRKGHA